MRAGELMHLVTLMQRSVGAVDAAGDPTETWADVGTAWCKIEPVSLSKMSGAREAVAAGADTSTDIVRVTMYPVDGIEPLKWRLRNEAGGIIEIRAARPSNDGFTMEILGSLRTAD